MYRCLVGILNVAFSPAKWGELVLFRVARIRRRTPAIFLKRADTVMDFKATPVLHNLLQLSYHRNRVRDDCGLSGERGSQFDLNRKVGLLMCQVGVLLSQFGCWISQVGVHDL